MSETAGKRQPIRTKIRRIVLLLSTALLLCFNIIGTISLVRVRDLSRDSLTDQLEVNLYNSSSDKAALSDAEFGKYTAYISSFADQIQDFYVNPENYVRREVLPPDMANADTLAMQRYLRDPSVTLEDIRWEMELFSNLQPDWNSSMIRNADVLTTIYLGTESGLMVDYDDNSEMGVQPGSDEAYFDYSGSAWYTLAKSTGEAGFTDIYPDSYGRGLMVTCYAPFYDGDGNFRGAVSMDMLISDIYDSIVSMNLGESGRVYLFDSSGFTVDRTRETEIVAVEDVLGSKTVIEAVRAGETGFELAEDDVYYAYARVSSTGWELCISIPAATVLEPVETMDNQVHLAVALFWIVFILLIPVAVLVTYRFSSSLTKPLEQLGKDAMIISSGNLDYRAAIRANDEIGDLALNFNTMAADLKKYMEDLTHVTAEKERIGAELNVATQIQADMLPRIFPPFPDRKEFDIFASMTPAKEVGGDFYDFFLVDEDHLALVMADVSGKGVPAALFMVIAKTLIKNRCLMGGTPGEVLSYVNTQLCEGNEAELFVTVWLAILEISTGKGLAANAGHEHPALKRAGEKFELVKYRHSPAVATMEGMRFREHSFELHPGDSLFVYTDGVTEATNAHNELFGEGRTIDALNGSKQGSAQELLGNVRDEISRFVGEAPQFDDITMLGFTYFGTEGKTDA